MELTGEVLVGGAAEGELLRLDAPISFWGGVDPGSGRITDPRHPQHGECVAGRVLAVARTIGSSSSSAILLELIAAGRAPAALLLGAPDAILLVGTLVARELGHPPVPAVRLDPEAFDALPAAAHARVHADGTVTLGPAGSR